MTLDEHLAALAAAPDTAALEAAFQAAMAEFPAWRMRGLQQVRTRAFARIDEAMRQRGRALCDEHPHGRLVPSLGARRRLTVCGETYRVPSGGNSTGVRYAWHGAQQWAMGLMRREGLSLRAAHAVWEWWSGYPHRALDAVEKGLAGKTPDPELGVLIRHADRSWGQPIRYSVEQNNADDGDRRATKPCPSCGATLFDWGAGHSRGFDFVNWHCNGCPDVFTEYMTHQQLCELRRQAHAVRETETA